MHERAPTPSDLDEVALHVGRAALPDRLDRLEELEAALARAHRHANSISRHVLTVSIPIAFVALSRIDQPVDWAVAAVLAVGALVHLVLPRWHLRSLRRERDALIEPPSS